MPGTNWIDHHTKDEGREALLVSSGALGRLPEAIDPAVVAAERDGDAWWVVMRDVSALLISLSGFTISYRPNFVMLFCGIV